MLMSILVPTLAQVWVPMLGQPLARLPARVPSLMLVWTPGSSRL